jgi:hypothetical protein
MHNELLGTRALKDICSHAYQKHCIEFSQSRDVHEKIPALLSTHHLVGNKDEMQLVASEVAKSKEKKECMNHLTADLHVGPILGYLV